MIGLNELAAQVADLETKATNITQIAAGEKGQALVKEAKVEVSAPQETLQIRDK